ncbi:hypothetical protein BT96DRAFT_1007695 [Gymnopus androsaceus JB14]|uniref:Uncharacterized protein n=1 Tax=Gymnopus androsaceus JB14 TaxID=1447944 RepID=A0A6A4GHH6_9AGAR|nr:hypothetical protein BT96DRAFT_1007695 [Gymnopus androsaceus JB14]
MINCGRPRKRICKAPVHTEHSEHYDPDGQEFPFYLLVGTNSLRDGIYKDRTIVELAAQAYPRAWYEGFESMGHAQLNWACYCSGNHAHAPLRTSINLPEPPSPPAPRSPIVISDSDDDEPSKPSGRSLGSTSVPSESLDTDSSSFPPPPPPSEVSDFELLESEWSASELDILTTAPSSPIGTETGSNVRTDSNEDQFYAVACSIGTLIYCNEQRAVVKFLEMKNLGLEPVMLGTRDLNLAMGLRRWY